nr:phospholipase D-like domain-containing protein [Candidatus Sigynarchaeota archaeon]
MTETRSRRKFETFKYVARKDENKTIPMHWRHLKSEDDIEGFKDNYIHNGKLGDFLVPGRANVLVTALKELVSNAREIICISSFLFQQSELIAALKMKASEGVRVYILSSLDKNIDYIPEEDANSRARISEENRTLLMELARFSLTRTALFHAKFLIVDPRSNPQGILSTANFTIDAITKNAELAIKLTPDQVRALFDLFNKGFWDIAQKELRKNPKSQQTTLDDLKNEADRLALQEHESILWTVGSGSTLKKKLLDLLQNPDEVIISTYNIKEDTDITRRIVGLSKKHVKITLFIRERRIAVPTIRSVLETILLNPNARILGHPFLHAKFVITRVKDHWNGILMSANIEEKGLDEGFEAGIFLSPTQINNLLSIYRSWESGFPMVLERPAKSSEIKGKVSFVENDDYKTIWIDECKVLDSKTIDVPSDLAHLKDVIAMLNDPSLYDIKLPRVDSTHIFHRFEQEIVFSVKNAPKGYEKIKVTSVIELTNEEIQLARKNIDKLKAEKEMPRKGDKGQKNKIGQELFNLEQQLKASESLVQMMALLSSRTSVILMDRKESTIRGRSIYVPIKYVDDARELLEIIDKIPDILVCGE